MFFFSCAGEVSGENITLSKVVYVLLVLGLTNKVLLLFPFEILALVVLSRLDFENISYSLSSLSEELILSCKLLDTDLMTLCSKIIIFFPGLICFSVSCFDISLKCMSSFCELLSYSF